MIIANESLTHDTKIEEQNIEQVGWNMNSQGTLEDEIDETIAKTGKLYKATETLFLSKIEIPQEVKTEVIRRVVKPILAHPCESRTTVQRR